MSNWQNLSATKPDGRRDTIWTAAIYVFFFPGLVGSIIGISLSALSGSLGAITDSNILNQFVVAMTSHYWMAILLFAAFAASMLSTIDGYALAVSQTATWDLLFPRPVAALLKLGIERPVLPEDRLVLNAGRLIVLVVAFLGAAGVMSLVIGGGISLFDIVYIVVIAQMSLVGPVLLCLFEATGPRVILGGLPIIAGLTAGTYLAAQKFTGNPELYAWAPVGAISFSVLSTLILWGVTSFVASRANAATGVEG